METVTIESLVGAVPRGRYLFNLLRQRGLEDRILCWTDRRYRFFQMYGLPVTAPADIPGEAELILLADHRNLDWWQAVAAEKGLSQVPLLRLECGDGPYEDIPCPPVKYTDERFPDSRLACVRPARLLGPDRLDVIVRYLACREFLAGTPGVGVQMYKKIVHSINQSRERIRPMTTCAYFSDYAEKKGYEAFESSFLSLIESMRKQGFLKQHFIPVSETGRPLNGRHRLAVALALGERVYIRRYVGFGEPFFRYAPEDLPALGFRPDEIALLVSTLEALRRNIT